MKRVATVVTALAGILVAGPVLAHGSKSPPTHVHYCNCGDSIGKAMCGSSSSSSSSSSGSTTSSTSGGTSTGGTTTSTGGTTTSTGGTTTTSSSSGGTAVPEPGMLGLMGLGFIGMAVSRRRRR